MDPIGRPGNPAGLERSQLAKVALAAWVGVTPDQLPAAKMWIEHPNHDSRKAWDCVIEALFAEFSRQPQQTEVVQAAHALCEDASPNSDAALALGSDCAVQAHAVLRLRRALSSLQPKDPSNAD